MITVQELMSPNPVTLSRFNTLHDARMIMQENRFRHIPIVDENDLLCGLVTQRNVLANGISSQNFADGEELSQIETGTLLADIMTTNVTTVAADVKISDAAQLLHRKKYGCLPVVNSNNQLIGIITDHDFVAMTIQLLDIMEQGEPPEYEQDY